MDAHSLVVIARGSVLPHRSIQCSASRNVIAAVPVATRLREPIQPHSRRLARSYTSASSNRSGRKSRSSSPGARYGSAAVALAGIGFGITTIHASNADERRPLADATWPELFRRYFVYACCSSAYLVDWSASIIETCRSSRVPGVSASFEWIMRRTFFPQFVGGDAIEDCMVTVQRASQASIGSILAFSAEAEPDHSGGAEKTAQIPTARATDVKGTIQDDDASQYLFTDRIDEMLHSIRVAGEFKAMQKASAEKPVRDDSVLVAIKLSGLLRDCSVLERASACLMPREEWVSPPSTIPPTDKVAMGACPGLMIPTSALSDSDIAALKALWNAMQAMASCARDHGHVRLLLDAEYSWYQPAIDAVFESCAQQYNKLAPPSRNRSLWPWKQQHSQDAAPRLPLIYNTYQAYLRRTPAYLSMSLERARQGGYSLGIKLVRGAYVEIENKLWNTTIVEPPPAMPSVPALVDGTANAAAIPAQWKSPVWPSKPLTDECYDACVARIMEEIKKDMDKNGAEAPARLAVVFAGHNWDSSVGVVEHMLRLGMAREPEAASNISPEISAVDRSATDLYHRDLILKEGVRGRIHVGQLFGMADDLSHTMRVAFDPNSGGDGPPFVLKYIPYGALSLTMPYLTRRAQENKSVMGSGRATRERALVIAEIGHRLRAWLPWNGSPAGH